MNLTDPLHTELLAFTPGAAAQLLHVVTEQRTATHPSFQLRGVMGDDDAGSIVSGCGLRPPVKCVDGACQYEQRAVP